MRSIVRVAWLISFSLISAPLLHAVEAPPTSGTRPAPPPAPAPSPVLNSALSQLQKADPNEDMTAPTNYDEVVHELIEQLLDRTTPAKKAREVIRTRRKPEEVEKDAISEKERYTISAQDAARKLASLGKRSVPDLTLLFKANYKVSPKSPDAEKAAQVTYYAVWALARIRTAEAARALIPLMLDSSSARDLRLMAVNAAGWEKFETGISVLLKIATSDPDIDMRKQAFAQLAMTPEYWLKNEQFFVKALSDPNDDIRAQAAKACHFSHVFVSANPKLVELIEKDSFPTVRIYAMLALARMRVQKAQPALIRLLQQKDLDEKLKKQALNSFVAITEIPFRSAESALAWWEKEGSAAFNVLDENEKRAQEAAGVQAKPLIVRAAESPAAPLTGTAPTPNDPASNSVNAEIIPLDPTPEKQPAPQPIPETPSVPRGRTMNR